ncbi:hypothetical protein C8Q74DRAFT_1305817 [Fomes fomentarius]|nr:hypothetical protein C8Q74DRAFT_1305817 [Fomes fomentarius]
MPTGQAILQQFSVLVLATATSRAPGFISTLVCVIGPHQEQVPSLSRSYTGRIWNALWTPRTMAMNRSRKLSTTAPKITYRVGRMSSEDSVGGSIGQVASRDASG